MQVKFQEVIFLFNKSKLLLETLEKFAIEYLMLKQSIIMFQTILLPTLMKIILLAILPLW